ncbi:hypothetical protein I6U48_26625 [Clostridium sp. PL3]|uniref:Uncharacterized protein n=1 Tax=Clostridium thailandense TaxID=2794346 RepID=A0A949U2X4_9CLOT|nr:hypothetical protein [Clostridium thailandense]MBV7276460.1 hypothetical protein [Clostridium thailandense]
MDEFTKQISELINQEVDRRVKKIVKQRIDDVVKSLANKLSIADIAWATELSVSEVRACLQETVDIQNNILKLCRKNDELETIESYFKLGKGKSGIEID